MTKKDLPEIFESTYSVEITCDECSEDVDCCQHCGEDFEPERHFTNPEIFCVEIDGGERLHFCSKECADAWLNEK